jgi:triphosphoribosyl-dephospho-CoA synthase
MTAVPAEDRPPAVPAARDLVMAAQLACLLEASAPKPGNVSPGRRFGDMGYEDFLASALALGDPLRHAPESSLGSTIRRIVEATARWTPANTNLGIVLLLVPLVRAAMRRIAVEETTALDVGTLRAEVRTVLAQTTVEDAREVYAAIRRAAPGGLGRADEQDVAQAPTVSLLETMQLAADRDGIAHEYASGFETTFEIGCPAIRAARHEGLPWDDAVVETFLVLLAARHDTHIARRGGLDAAKDVSARAAQVLSAGGVRTDAGRGMIDAMHRELCGQRNLLNPGTAADLTAAAIFVLLATGGWSPGRAAA